jgi:DNA-binding MarR family transcriptional regulator
MTLPFSSTLEVRDRCLCFRTQRAARLLARRFDTVFRPFDLTNGQFSLMMSLNRPEPPTLGEVAPFLGMDRTSLTAALKPLRRRGLLMISVDAKDRRGRRLIPTEEGRALLDTALPVWRAEHDRLDAALLALEEAIDPSIMRAGLTGLAQV